MEIRPDDLRSKEIAQLLKEHLEDMYKITPAESVHALDLEALRVASISFYSAWEANSLLGCGALKELDAQTGEVKSMRTVIEHRGKGVAASILGHIINEASQRGYEHLYLETGSMPEFAPARALYLRFGFEYQGPFGDYVYDPNSLYMIKKL